MQDSDRFDSLGQLEDLPQDYRDELQANNLVPLWPSLRAVLPPHLPSRKTQFTHWAFSEIRPLLVRAGELTPIEKAERRVLVLANPGHSLEKMQASAAIYLGMQLLLPGELAPAHRHTPNAVRMVVEGEGAWTLVDGEKCPMKRGDLILTPTGLWHEHGHDGQGPVIWLDVLDLPIIYYSETSYHEEGPSQSVVTDGARKRSVSRGITPTRAFSRESRAYPLLRYAWEDTKAALSTIAAENPEEDCIQVTYVNPDTGAHVQNILGFYALMLRPGQVLSLPARSPAQVFHLIEGQVAITAGAITANCLEADTSAVPGYTPVMLANKSSDRPAYLFVADETPLHQKLGVYEVRSHNPHKANL